MCVYTVFCIKTFQIQGYFGLFCPEIQGCLGIFCLEIQCYFSKPPSTDKNTLPKGKYKYVSDIMRKMENINL